MPHLSTLPRWFTPASLLLILTLVFLLPHTTKADEGPRLDYRLVDVTQAKCLTIKSFRKQVEGAYAYNKKLVQQAYDETKKYSERQLQQCLLVSQLRSDAKSCDDEWNNVQQAYDKAAKNLSDKQANADYKAAKDKWDACYKQSQDRGKGQEFIPKEWECYEAHERMLSQAKQEMAKELDWLAKKHDADTKYLDELQKKCAAPKKNPPPNDPGTPVWDPHHSLPHVDVSKTTCPEIRATQRLVESVFKHNSKILEELYTEGTKVYKDALKSCLANAKNADDKKTCTAKYDEYTSKLLSQYVDDMETENNVRNKNLDYLDKLAEFCKKKTGMSFPGGDGENDPIGEVDVTKATCATIRDFRLYVKDEFIDRTDAAEKAHKAALKVASKAYQECISDRYSDKEECQTNYRANLKQLETILTDAIAKALAKEEKDLHYLDELQKKCGSVAELPPTEKLSTPNTPEPKPTTPKNNPPEKNADTPVPVSSGVPSQIPTYTDTNFPDDVNGKLLPYPKLTSAQCSVLDRARTKLEDIRRYNLHVIDLLHFNAVDYAVKQRDQCIANATTDDAKSDCGAQATITTDALRDTTDKIMKDDENNMNARLKPLDAAEAKCGGRT